MRASRLGDDIDDFCVKCKRVMNHAVVSLLNDGPAKVRCKTCHGDHDFRHEQAPPPKVDPRKAALFNQVLETVTIGAPNGSAAPNGGAAPNGSAAPEETVASAETAPAPKPKTRGKARA